MASLHCQLRDSCTDCSIETHFIRSSSYYHIFAVGWYLVFMPCPAAPRLHSKFVGNVNCQVSDLILIFRIKTSCQLSGVRPHVKFWDWDLLSALRIETSCQLSELTHHVDCQDWDLLSTVGIETSCKLSEWISLVDYHD